jgi:hypothetical protein
LLASDRNTTKRPSSLIEGFELLPFAGSPSKPALASSKAPLLEFFTKILETLGVTVSKLTEFVANATKIPFPLTAAPKEDAFVIIGVPSNPRVIRVVVGVSAHAEAARPQTNRVRSKQNAENGFVAGVRRIDGIQVIPAGNSSVPVEERQLGVPAWAASIRIAVILTGTGHSV